MLFNIPTFIKKKYVKISQNKFDIAVWVITKYFCISKSEIILNTIDCSIIEEDEKDEKEENEGKDEEKKEVSTPEKINGDKKPEVSVELLCKWQTLFFKRNSSTYYGVVTFNRKTFQRKTFYR